MTLRMERNGPTPKLLEAFAQQSGFVSKIIAGVRVMRRWAAGKFVLEKLIELHQIQHKMGVKSVHTYPSMYFLKAS